MKSGRSVSRQANFPPDFLILGAQKCGTTSLAAALRSHPEIFVPEFKEAWLFGFVEDGEVGGANYQSFFSKWAGEPVVGEATPEYLFRAESAEQICRHLPEVKAIVMLRNPVDRAYSAYWHGERVGMNSGSFTDTIDAEFASGLSLSIPFGELVRHGHYAEQIQRYFDNGLDRQRMLVLLSEEMLVDPAGSLSSVQKFLGVEPVLVDLPRSNATRASYLPRPVRSLLFRHWRTRPVKWIEFVTLRPFTPPPMDPEVRSRLVEHFRPWNERLAELLGRELTGWDR